MSIQLHFGTKMVTFAYDDKMTNYVMVTTYKLLRMTKSESNNAKKLEWYMDMLGTVLRVFFLNTKFKKN
jgi:hypothetical protein